MEAFGLAAAPGALCLAAGLTILLHVETTRFPWSPFFFIHAILSILVPVLAGAWPGGNPFPIVLQNWRIILLFLLLLCLWEHLVSGYLFEQKLLKWLGKDRDPRFAPSLTLDTVLDKSTGRLRISRAAAQSLFAGFALLWAPFGEDLFFWGYLHATLAEPAGFWPATLFVSALFALHHVFYLGGQWDRKPWGSLAAFAVSSFVTGILMSLLFRSTQSLYPLMAVHFGVNVFWILLSTRKY